MKSALSSLQERRDAFDKMKKNYEDTVAHIQVTLLTNFSKLSRVISKVVLCSCRGFVFQVQARFVERRTRDEFEKLRSFLQAEEEVRMEALRREEEQKSEQMKQKIEEMERKITSVSASIRDLEEEIALEGISVLHVSLYMLYI